MKEHVGISLSERASEHVAQKRFHDYRMQFNSAFLSEDYALAEESCLQALSLESLSLAESEELLRYLRMLGKGQMALETVNGFLEQNPGDPKLMNIKLDLLLQLGLTDEYEALVKRALEGSPQNEFYYWRLHDILKSGSRMEELQDLIQQAAAQNIKLSQDETCSPNEEDSTTQHSISDANLQSYLQLFTGRENAYARQWVNDQGNSGYALVNEPLTMSTLRNHLQGSYTLGVYQLDSESKVGWIVFDLDLAKEHQNELLNPEFKSWVSALLLEKTQEIAHLLSVYHIPCSIEFSGFKGYHVWVFFEHRISAALAKAFVERISAQIPMDGLPLHLELFPKQSRIKQGYGNLVKLPYGIHRRSGKLSTILDADLCPMELSDFIVSVKKADSQAFIAALDSMGYTHSQELLRQEQNPDASEMPISVQADPEQDIEWLCLKQHCYVLSFVDAALSTRSVLSGTQKNILRYTVGYLKNGPAIVNKLLSKCRNPDPGDYMKSAFKGNAMGCAKIRNSISSEIDISLCNCSFDMSSASYANPLLHLEKLEPISSQSSDLNEMKLKELVDGYLRLLKNYQEVSRRLRNIEAQIINLFENVGIDHINTDYGDLCYDKAKAELTLSLKSAASKDS
jgi:hypothetical protein